MQFYYGEKNLCRAIDETEFWKHQEAEHTTVIRQLVPNLEPRYVEELKQYEEQFHKAEETATQFTELLVRSRCAVSPALQQQIIQFIEFTLLQSQQWIMFLNQMLAESQAVSANPVAQVVIHHIIRESEYYIGIAQTVMENAIRIPV